jgi:hypothetical protein
VLILVAATLAFGHPSTHHPVRHDLHLLVTDDEAVLTVDLHVPAEALAHDPVLQGTSWLRAGLELRTPTDSARIEVQGSPTARRAVARVPLNDGSTELTVADATLLTERNELRWRLEGPRIEHAEGLDDVFDGRRRSSLRDRWVLERPRQVVVKVAAVDPSSGVPWWTGAAVPLGALALLGISARAAQRGRQPARSSHPPAPR